jgi:integrase
LSEHDPALHAFVAVAAFTGARPAQLLGLRWRTVSFDAGRVAFTAGWVEGPYGPVLAATKTRRRHAVDVDEGTLTVLAAHADRCRAANGGALPVDGFVFSDDPAGAKAWKPNRATKAFLRARRAAGLREFRLHDLRHFMATQMLDAGVPLPVVSRRLDHRRMSTTLDRYAHAVPGGDALAARTLWRLVHPAP